MWPPVADVSGKRSLDCMLIKLAIYSFVKVDEYQSVGDFFYFNVIYNIITVYDREFCLTMIYIIIIFTFIRVERHVSYSYIIPKACSYSDLVAS